MFRNAYHWEANVKTVLMVKILDICAGADRDFEENWMTTTINDIVLQNVLCRGPCIWP